MTDFLKRHNIPYPDHLAGWDEFEHARILRFKGEINSSTIPKILEFKERLEKSGLPPKNVIIDGKDVTDVDSAAVAALLAELKREDQKIALINVDGLLLSYLELFHQKDQVPIFGSEQIALDTFNKRDNRREYFSDVPRVIRKNKCLSLLIALIAFLAALPFFEANMTAVIYLAVFTFVLISGIYAVSYNMRHVAGGVFLAVPTLVTSWSNMFLKSQQILNAEIVFLAIFLIYTLSVILWHILAVKKITINELFGAMCVYIMVGMTFGLFYAFIESLRPGSLSYPEGEVSPQMTAFFYFSFVSMSSTGFSGFTAVSSLARSVVIVQVIIGVMFISALIGKLVSANTPDEEGLFDQLEPRINFETWSQELTENFFRQRPLLLVLSMAMLNYSGSVLMTVLKWPIFLDSMGTSLAVLLGGIVPGLMAGIIYNLVMALTFWQPQDWVWMFCNVCIAVLTWLFCRWRWINLHRPGHLLAAGIISGIFNSLVVMITTHLAHFPVYQGTMTVYHFFASLTKDPLLASIAEKIVVEITDKSISLILAAVAVIFIRDYLHWNRGKILGPIQ